MPKYRKRMKASDVFSQTDHLFGEKVTFEKAYPQVSSVRVEVTETGDGLDSPRTSVYTERTLGEYIDCSNPRCYNGGFRIGSILSQMVYGREEKQEFFEGCQGYEGSPKGRRKYQPCTNYFKGTVAIKYRESEATDGAA